MFKIKCDNCNNYIVLNQKKTMDYYMDTMQYTIERVGNINYDQIPLFTFYKCHGCKKEYKFDVKEYELRVKKTLVEMALKIKRSELLSSINPYNIDPDNGMEFCGICEGYDQKGNCFVDMVKQCPLRRLNK